MTIAGHKYCTSAKSSYLLCLLGLAGETFLHRAVFQQNGVCHTSFEMVSNADFDKIASVRCNSLTKIANISKVMKYHDEQYII